MTRYLIEIIKKQHERKEQSLKERVIIANIRANQKLISDGRLNHEDYRYVGYRLNQLKWKYKDLTNRSYEEVGK